MRAPWPLLFSALLFACDEHAQIATALDAAAVVDAAADAAATPTDAAATEDAGCPPPPWATDIVQGGEAGEPVLAIDAFDNLHVAYRAASDRAIWYATNRSGAWTKERIGEGAAFAFTVDGAGDAHLLTALSTLRYTTNRGHRWNTEVIRTGLSYDTRLALTVDNAGDVHATYSDFEETFTSRTGGRAYATNPGGTWRFEAIEPTKTSGGWIGVDPSSGAVSVFYLVVDETRRAVREGSSWTITKAVAPAAWDVAFDRDGRAHVVSGREHLSYWRAGDAAAQPLDLLSDFHPRWSAVALGTDGSGAAHLAYTTPTGSLRYASNTSGAWRLQGEPLNGERQTRALALATERNGRPHVVYADWNAADLRHARAGAAPPAPASPRPGTWASEVVATAGPDLTNDADAVMASDRRGGLHLVYAFRQRPGGGGGADLRAATRGERGWTSTVVGDGWGGLDERQVSMAIDRDGHTHLVYRGAVGLRYATDQSGAWTNLLVTEDGIDPDGLAVADDGSVHLVYALPRPTPVRRLRHTVIVRGQVMTTQNVSDEPLPYSVALLVGRDAGGTVHAFYAASGGSFRHAALAPGAGSWSVETLPSTCAPLALAEGAELEVICASGSERMRRGPDGWVSVGGDALGLAGSPLSVAVGRGRTLALGAPTSPGWTAVATNADGAWVRELVTLGGAPALAFDGGGVLHAAYYDEATRSLLWGTRQPARTGACAP